MHSARKSVPGGLSTTSRMIFPCVYEFVDTFTQVYSVLHLTLLLCCTRTGIYSSSLHLHKNMPLCVLLQKLQAQTKCCHIVRTDDLLDCSPGITCPLRSAESFSLTSAGIQWALKCLLVPSHLFLFIVKNTQK